MPAAAAPAEAPSPEHRVVPKPAARARHVQPAAQPRGPTDVVERERAPGSASRDERASPVGASPFRTAPAARGAADRADPAPDTRPDPGARAGRRGGERARSELDCAERGCTHRGFGRRDLHRARLHRARLRRARLHPIAASAGAAAPARRLARRAASRFPRRPGLRGRRAASRSPRPPAWAVAARLPHARQVGAVAAERVVGVRTRARSGSARRAQERRAVRAADPVVEEGDPAASAARVAVRADPVAGRSRWSRSGRARVSVVSRVARAVVVANREELQPMDVPTYTPTDAPVPEGEIVVERASTRAGARSEAQPHRGRRRALPACSRARWSPPRSRSPTT